MQKTVTQMVREFHEKHGFAQDTSIFECGNSGGSEELEAAAVIISTLAKKFETGKPNQSDGSFDLRLLRAHLLLEELAETLVALARRNLVKLADGAGDLDYVLHGTCIAFGINLEDITAEIHKSNMTKAIRRDTVDDPRLRNKGDSYVPPDIEGALLRSQGVE